ncbi:MAG TPA: UDP-N-acetylmuramoyl-L-alanine--D-glutamate ligase [Polyangia bacterium]
MDLNGKRVLVVGLGRSGIAAAQLCVTRGARVTVTDKRDAAALPGLDALPPEVARELGGHRRETFTGAELIVLSPGVPEIPELAAARSAGVAITGEMELASRFVSSTLIAITGTNGKSTTTTLVGEMMRATGRPTFVGGNLGEPLAEAVPTRAGDARGICVVEASSFQLETVDTFHPRVAVLLNITADHLDRYPDMDGYAAAKARIFAAQTGDDFAVVNVEDPLAMRASRGIASRRIGFSTVRPLPEGGYANDNSLVLKLPDQEPESYTNVLPWLIGQRHNQANALAALLASRLAGASRAEVRAGLLAFKPLAHRMELVADVDNVAYYDDSKGTNVSAVVAALDGFSRRVVLIAGGRDKGGAYEPLADVLARVGRAAVLIGEAADKMQAAFAGKVETARATTMDDAVEIARRFAQPGDAVVLSPACSSFDMFRDYAHRAEVFRAAVARVVARERAS